MREGFPAEENGAPEEVMRYDPRRGEYVVSRPVRPFPRVQAILFLLTLVSTTVVGGFAYALSLLAILLAHEMGHYLTARYHRIPATLPYFLPMPFTIFGTFGAVIRMDGRTATRKELFDVGVAGPLAGTLVAIPVSLYGLHLSSVVDGTGMEGLLALGDSILFSGLGRLVHGPLPEGSTLLLHPVAFAGWAGLFVTALNLLPIGQLDGGHVLYGLLGRSAAPVSLVVFLSFGLLALFASPGWLILVFLLLYFGYRHPPAREEDVGMDRKRKWIGVVTLALFILAFTPVPILYSVP